MNLVHSGSFVTLHYRLTGADGAEVISTFGARPATLSLGSGQLAPAIEARLIGLAEGAHARFALGPDEAFGERSADKLQRVARTLLPQPDDADAGYAVGDVVGFPVPGGQGTLAAVVREAGSDWLLCDFNHPLAGQPLQLEVQLIGVL